MEAVTFVTRSLFQRPHLSLLRIMPSTYELGLGRILDSHWNANKRPIDTKIRVPRHRVFLPTVTGLSFRNFSGTQVSVLTDRRQKMNICKDHLQESRKRDFEGLINCVWRKRRMVFILWRLYVDTGNVAFKYCLNMAEVPEKDTLLKNDCYNCFRIL